MSKQSLKYIGPVSSIKIGSEEKPLITGKTYDDLPRDHNTVARLIAINLLIEVEAKAEPKEPVAKTDPKTKSPAK